MIYLLTFYIEAFVIYNLELKLWRTRYTPTNILLIPYAILLPISITAITLKSGLSFYYPSILVWSIGLLIFEIPSLLMSLYNYRIKKTIITSDYKNIKWKYYLWINGILCILFLLKLLLLSRSGIPIGSDQFGEMFATYGIWGHLNLLFIAFTISNIVLIGKECQYNKLLVIYIVIGSLICFLNQVKGWVLIPIIAGIIIRLLENRMEISIKLISIVVLLGSFLFFMSYYVALVLNSDADDSSWFIEFFINHFIFYLTSGINGLSEMFIQNLPTHGNLYNAIANLFYPLKIIVGLFSPSEEIVSYSKFLYIGYGESNVRTFFGDMYISGGITGGSILCLFYSFFSYFFFVFALHDDCLFIKAAYGFIAGILFMSWFSSYFNLLNTYEVPAWCFILYLFVSKHRFIKYGSYNNIKLER